MARGKMFRWRRGIHLLASLACLVGSVGLTAGQASAHVLYRQPLNEIGSLTTQVGSNAGWLAGQNSVTWTDSHLNRFLWFHLGERSQVDFTIRAVDGFVYVPHGSTTPVTALGDLNPGYSIFEGLVPQLSHDGAPYPGQTSFAPWSPFVGPRYGREGDPNSQKWGEYRSNADFTLASQHDWTGSSSVERPEPVWATVRFIAGDGNHLGHEISGSYVLDPGDYSLVVGGANHSNLAQLFENLVASESCRIAGEACDAYRTARLGRGFTIEFSTRSIIPLPAAAYLFGAGLVGLAGLARRKKVEA